MSTQAFKDHPDIADVDVESPLIVLGSPRTGTTLIHQLLATHPDARTLKLWELHRPCPPPRPEREANDPRIKKSDREFGMFYRLVPGMRAIHNMEPEGPEECLHLFVNTFSCRTSFSVMSNMSKYQRFIMDLDMVPAYEQYKRDLQILNYHYPGRLIVLKSPAHLQCMEALHTVFPKAKLVQLHRDPVSAAGSFCSLSEAVQISLRRQVKDLNAIGDTWNALWTTALKDSISVREGRNFNILD
ncbi:MAG: sulfotransferase, partial [Myxococcales bacterium]|nr:sulfotransferase [Myxococcales bacterium]